MNIAAMNLGVQISFQDPDFNSFVGYSEVGLLDPIFSFGRQLRSVFYSSSVFCVTLNSYQQGASVPISPHLHQNLLFYVFSPLYVVCFLIMAILTGVK